MGWLRDTALPGEGALWFRLQRDVLFLCSPASLQKQMPGILLEAPETELSSLGKKLEKFRCGSRRQAHY